MTYYSLIDGSVGESEHRVGWNNVGTQYEGPYYETTSAYNSYGFYSSSLHLSGEGNAYISNVKEALLAKSDIRNYTSANAYAKAP